MMMEEKMRNYLKRTAAALAIALAASGEAAAADTFMVKLQNGIIAVPRGISSSIETVVLGATPGSMPQYVDLRQFTGFRYQVQGASCGVAGCNDYDVPVVLYVSFDDGGTWAPLGSPAAAVVSLKPRSDVYSPPLRPTTTVTIPTNQRKNNALLRGMVYYEEKPYVTVGDQSVQFYR